MVSISVTQVQAYPPTKTAGKFIRFYPPLVSFEKKPGLRSYRGEN